MSTGSSTEESPDPRISELEARISALEHELAESIDRSAASRRRLERELSRVTAVARERERALAQAVADNTRLRGRKSVRLALSVAESLRAPIIRARQAVSTGRRIARGTVRRLGIRRLLGRPGRARHQHEIAAGIRAALPPAPAIDGSVTVIVESRTHPAALRDCLASLQDTDWADLEIVVAGPHADNQVRAATDGDQRTTEGRRRVRPVSGASPSDSRREALAITSGELVVFLHDDVQPLEPGWLARMVATLRDEGAAAVGARLLLPAGGGDPKSGVMDVSIAHLGL